MPDAVGPAIGSPALRHVLPIAAISCLSACLSACASGPGTALRVATGSASHFVCAGTFGSGEPAAQVYRDTFGPVPGIGLIDWAMDLRVDAERREVRTTLGGGFVNRAVWRDGLGCLVVHGEVPDESAAAVRAAPAPAWMPEIAGPEVVAPADPRLAAILDRAFAEPEAPPFRRTKAVVLVQDGRVIGERYAPGYGVATPLLGNSATKSVINALIGILVADGRLAIEGPAPVPAWADPADPRHAISIDDLLRMRSGLALGSSLEASLGSLWSPANRMLFVERDMAGFAVEAPLEAPPRGAWNYTDGNYLILSRIIRDAAGGSATDALRFAHERLFGPLGMRHVVLPVDAAGTPVGAAHMMATARDWARLGLLYLNDGMAGGRRLLPEGWVRYSAAATPDAWVGYGAGFWTNDGASFGATRRAGLGMPRDAFFARGAFGQYVVIMPSARLVVVRLGTTHGEQDLEGVAQLVADTIAATGARE